MTTTLRTCDSQPAISQVDAAASISPEERAALLKCVNGVRSGEVEYYVVVTNRKQTKSKKRMPGEDYAPDPALVPYAHKGWLVAANKNQKKEVYLHIYDEARAKLKGDNYGHTRVTLRGLRSFKIETDPRTGEEITRPGPMGLDDPAADPAPVAEAQAPVAPFDPNLAAQSLMVQSQAFMAQSQAFMAQSQALMMRAYGQNTPL